MSTSTDNEKTDFDTGYLPKKLGEVGVFDEVEHSVRYSNQQQETLTTIGELTVEVFYDGKRIFEVGSEFYPDGGGKSMLDRTIVHSPYFTGKSGEQAFPALEHGNYHEKVFKFLLDVFARFLNTKVMEGEGNTELYKRDLEKVARYRRDNGYKGMT